MKHSRTYPVLILVSLFAATGCVPPRATQPTESASAPTPPTSTERTPPSPDPMKTPSWRSPLRVDHPLVGQIWNVREGAACSEAELVEALRGARYVLLGEQHDNADHHALQARLVEQIVGPSRAPAVAFEMFDVPDQPAIDAYMAHHPDAPSGLGEAVGWASKGWPAWDMYEPIVAAAVRGGAKIVAANLARSEVMSVAKSGAVELEGESIPVPELPAAQLEAMKEELFQAHCQHLPKNMMGMMAKAQIARDLTLARRMTGADTGAGAVLIAGNGHVRRDWGVPWHLRNAEDQLPIVAVGMVEVQEGQDDPGAYGEQGGPPYDFVWFTPGWDRGDPCAEFKGRS